MRRRSYRVDGLVSGSCDHCADGWITGPPLPPLDGGQTPYTSVIPCRVCLLGHVHWRRGVRQGYVWLEAAA